MRNTKIYQVTDPGRDQGKRFLLTEMSALKAERWATRALLALSHSGIEIPDSMLGGGMASLAQIAPLGFAAIAKLDYFEVEPLLNEMLTCIQVMPDDRNDLVMRPLIPDDIEEVRTIVKLRLAIFQLHVDFSLPVGAPVSTSSATGPLSSS